MCPKRANASERVSAWQAIDCFSHSIDHDSATIVSFVQSSRVGSSRKRTSIDLPQTTKRRELRGSPFMVGGAIREECHREAGSTSPLLFQMELLAPGVGASPGMAAMQDGECEAGGQIRWFCSPDPAQPADPIGQKAKNYDYEFTGQPQTTADRHYTALARSLRKVPMPVDLCKCRGAPTLASCT